jgi:hypothetical protein
MRPAGHDALPATSKEQTMAEKRQGQGTTRKQAQAAEAREALGNLTSQIAELETLSVGQLKDRYEAVFGEAPRSRNRSWLAKRVAFRLQEIAEGSLSERARKRIDELAGESPVVRHRAPRQKKTAQPAAPEAAETAPTTTSAPTTNTETIAPPAKERDPRLPEPGVMLRRTFRDVEYTVTVLEDGAFEFQGERVKSLSAIAKRITGTSWNGWTFFGLNPAAKKEEA